MKKLVRYFLVFVRSNTMLIAFCFAWCIGCVLGCYLACLLPGKALLTIRASILNPIGITDVLASALFPLGAFIALLHLYSPAVILMTFVKATSFAFCSYGVHLAFGSAGWLMRSLLLCSDVCLIASLLWCACKRFSGDGNFRTKDFVFIACFVLTVSLVDCYVISPFCYELS